MSESKSIYILRIINVRVERWYQWYSDTLRPMYNTVSRHNGTCHGPITSLWQIGRPLCKLGLTADKFVISRSVYKKVEKWLRCGLKTMRNGSTLSCINESCLLIMIEGLQPNAMFLIDEFVHLLFLRTLVYHFYCTALFDLSLCSRSNWLSKFWLVLLEHTCVHEQ